jgi:hypothetical protein
MTRSWWPDGAAIRRTSRVGCLLFVVGTAVVLASGTAAAGSPDTGGETPPPTLAQTSSAPDPSS